MTRRRKLLLASLALFTAAVVLALPAVHWRLYGWARGEPFWRGRPASFYAADIRANYELQPEAGFPKPRSPSSFETWARQHFSLRLVELVWAREVTWDGSGYEALPVLVALLDEPDWRVRVKAMLEVTQATYSDEEEPPGQGAAPAVPTLVRLLDDPDPIVRSFAALVLRDVGPPAAEPAVPKLLRLRDDPTAGIRDWTVGHAATSALRTIDPDAAGLHGRP